jgi:hypothetical protein
MEVDMSWLEKLPEEERPRRKGDRGAPPPLPAGVARPKNNTIPVQSRWLVPPIPKDEVGKEAGERPRRPHQEPPAPESKPVPASVAAKPRGKLPPPLPREDQDE